MIKWFGITLATIATLDVAAHVAPSMAASANEQKARSAPTLDPRLRSHFRYRHRIIGQPSYYGRPRFYARRHSFRFRRSSATAGNGGERCASGDVETCVIQAAFSSSPLISS